MPRAFRLTSRGFTTRAALKEIAEAQEGAALFQATELPPPAQSSACPVGPKPRSGEGVNPMLCAVPRGGSPANLHGFAGTDALPSTQGRVLQEYQPNCWRTSHIDVAPVHRRCTFHEVIEYVR